MAEARPVNLCKQRDIKCCQEDDKLPPPQKKRRGYIQVTFFACAAVDLEKILPRLI